MQNEIQVGRYSAMLHKLLQMKEGAPSPTLATDIFPTISLEVDRPEWKFLGGEMICSGWGAKAAAAGEYGNVVLENPTGSGALVVLERIGISIATAGQVEAFPLYSSAVSALAAVSTRFAADLRWANPSGSFFKTSVAMIRQGNLSPISGGFAYFYPLANTTSLFDLGFVLSPGTAVSIRAATVNIAMRVWFRWRERVLEQSETR